MKVVSIRDLSAELDERGLSLQIFNTSDIAWAVHLYAHDDPAICFIGQGDDLRSVIEGLLSRWDRGHCRDVLVGQPKPSHTIS